MTAILRDHRPVNSDGAGCPVRADDQRRLLRCAVPLIDCRARSRWTLLVPGDVTLPRAAMSDANEDINRRYFVHYVASVAKPGARVLDFGCGAGRLVNMLLALGYDAYGCDIHWPGAGYSFAGPAAEFGRLKYFDTGGRLPFDDDTFDVIVSDQVFEHVVPLHASVAELERVVKPGGIMYHHFPASEVWREGHIGIPFCHRLPQGEMRLHYATLLRSLGAGVYKDDRPPREWAQEQLRWVDDWTVYRPAPELHKVFGRNATIRHCEIEYCRFRASERRWLRGLLDRPAIVPATQWLFRRLAFMALECRLVSHRVEAGGQAP
jgi:SAM-dependent methyltransferase